MEKVFKDYFVSATDEQKKIQNSIFEKIKIKEETAEKLKTINKKIKLILFAEIYCPDCRIFIPFLARFRDENKNIQIEVGKRSGQENEIKKEFGVDKIPTLLKQCGTEYKKIYEEFPDTLKLKMESEPAVLKGQYIHEYRVGRYNLEIEKQLLEKIMEE